MKIILSLQIQAILNYLRNTYVYVNSIYLCLRKQGSHIDNNSKSTYKTITYIFWISFCSCFFAFIHFGIYRTASTMDGSEKSS